MGGGKGGWEEGKGGGKEGGREGWRIGVAEMRMEDGKEWYEELGTEKACTCGNESVLFVCCL